MQKYKLGSWIVDPAANQLSNNEQTKSIEPKCMDLLLLLIRADGELVSRNDIMTSVWDGRYVTELVLNNLVALLRKHLRDADKQVYIKTRPKKGYQLIVKIHKINAKSLQASTDEQLTPKNILAEDRLEQTHTAREKNHDNEPDKTNQNRSANKHSTNKTKYIVVASVVAISILFLSWASGYLVAPSNKNISVAVLPINVFDSSDDAQYFADGLVEETLYQLSASTQLNVKSRSSAFAIDDSLLDVQEIADKLNADYVLEGSLRAEHGMMRITARLVNGATGNQLWTKVFTANNDSVLMSQSDISEALTLLINDSLQTPDTRIALENNAVPREAYLYLLRGRKLNAEGTTEAYASAIDEFNMATMIAPNYLEAHADLAMNYMILAQQRAMPAEDAKRLAYASIQKAISIDPEHAMSNSILATYYQNTNEHDKAEQYYKKALAIEPDLYVAAVNYAKLMRLKGRYQESLQQYYEVLKRSPRASPAQWAVGNLLVSLGRFDEAESHYKSCVKLLPKFTDCSAGLAYVQRLTNQSTQADATLNAYKKIAEKDTFWFNVISAWHYLWQNEPNLAMTSYLDVFTENSYAADGVTNATQAAWQLNNLDSWLVTLESALKQRRNIKTFAALAYGAYLNDDCQNSIEKMETLLQHQPYYFENFSVMANAFSFRGALAYCYKKMQREEDFTIQMTALENSVAEMPSNRAFVPGFELIKGHLYILQGNDNAAKEIVSAIDERNASLSWMFYKDPIYASALNSTSVSNIP